MKRHFLFGLVLLIFVLIAAACRLQFTDDGEMESTRIALAIEQTRFAQDQNQLDQAVPVDTMEVPVVLPTYTLYPTYTSEALEQAAVEVQPTVTQQPIVEEETATEEETQPTQTFEDWLEDVDILLYDDMYGMGESLVIENAIDGLGLGSNTVNVRDAMGNFLKNMNSSTQWDLIIIGAESRDSISGEYFDVLTDELDRGASVILEIWYIDDIASGRIQPVMQRCGIAFHRDWWREPNGNLNEYLVYLLEPDDPMFSEPNSISMLIPYDVLWELDVGDMVKINSGSEAVLLGGAQKKEHRSYGLLAECLDGRMVWQLFSTHDYKGQEMINLWQNYIINTLRARYEYLQN